MCLTEITREEEIADHSREILALARTLINDLRSPLAAVRLGAELLNRHDLSPEQRQRLARNVLLSVARIEEILLDFASQFNGGQI